MRQVGILAAAGLIALDRVSRLADDHARARVLASAAAERWPGSVDVALVQTNIVRIRHDDPKALLGHLDAHGVLAVPGSADTVRLVTHADVDDADVERAVAALETAP
jgi:threonine aldolase